jgi:ABC-type uncharacterized transport system ATPase subunit
MPLVLELHNLTKTIPGVQRNGKIDQTLSKGEVFDLPGENGVEITTLIIENIISAQILSKRFSSVLKY